MSHRLKLLSFLMPLAGLAPVCDLFPMPTPTGPTVIEFARTGCSTVSWSVSLKAVTTDTARNFQWYFTDGVTLSGQNVVHTFNEVGDHQVTLVAGSEVVRVNVTVPVSGDADGGPDPFGDRCVPDEGREHVAQNTTVTYRSNPPASGKHYSASGIAPINPGVYPNPVRPEVWVHNLEHGHVVVLYDCDGECSAEFKSQLQAMFVAMPLSKFGFRKLVVSPYEGLPVPVMAVAWDVQRDFSSVDIEGIKAFYNRRVDRGPEDEP